MAAQDVPRGNVIDFLVLGDNFEVIEGPNLQRSPDNLTQINSADGTFLQEDVSRRRVSGTVKAYMIDSSGTLPTAGAVWTITGASGAPYKVRIDEVNDEGQTEDGYHAYSISFHYFETIADGTLVLTDITTAPA